MGILLGNGVRRNAWILDYACRIVIDNSREHRRE
jgi:hypothetical protein